MPIYANRIDLRHLRYFVAIVSEGSFRAAAETLNISQPPLTRQIQQLEEIIGATLLIRRSNGIQTTPAGSALFTEAQNILNLVERACANTQRIGTGLMGRLDVGVFGSAVLDIVPRIVLHFRNRFPDVEVVLHNMDRETQVKALHERRIEIGFNRFFEDHPDLMWEQVIRQEMLAIVPEGHVLTTRKVISLRDLAEEPLIFYPRTTGPGGFSNYLMRLFHALNIEPHIVQSVDDVMTAVAFVSSGLGLTLGVDSARNLRLPGVAYLPLEEGEASAFDLSVIYRAVEQSPLLNAFLLSVRSIRQETKSISQ
jgi:LysR family transcriptional regulator, benzoate and cis,cis-muconate-responsive activator of ben and cat genes